MELKNDIFPEIIPGNMESLHLLTLGFTKLNTIWLLGLDLKPLLFLNPSIQSLRINSRLNPILYCIPAESEG